MTTKHNTILTLDQLNSVYKYVEDIINAFDDDALNEIFSGDNADIDALIEMLLEEACSILNSNNPALKSISTWNYSYLEKLTKNLDITLRKQSLNYFILTTLPEFEMNWHHIEWGNLIQGFQKLCILAARDHGKCLKINTLVLMYDGSVKKIQDIVVGDLVMGIDSKPRKILSTHNGVGQLYKVKQSNGDDYVVNSKHILTVLEKAKKEHLKKNTYFECVKDIEICDLLRKSDYYLNTYIRGFKAPIEYSKRNLFEIPTKIKRKQVKEYSKSSNKDKGIIDGVRIGKTSSLKFEDIGEGEYYGFACDGDHRFLLADGTVTHNSYEFSYAYPLWRMYRYTKATLHTSNYEYMLSQKGMLITNEFKLAKALLRIIKEGIENNDFLREALYPGQREGWAVEEITCKNNANFMIKSYGSKMRGFHPHYIIIDDFLNDQVIYSRDQREKYWKSFQGVIMNMIHPKGQIIVVGTPYIQEDLYDKLKADRTFKVFEYPGIFPNGKMLWENRHSFDSLMDKKEVMGSVIFSREILVKPISDTSSIFPYEIIKKSYHGMDNYILAKNIYSFPKKFEKVITGTDFAISGNVAADYSVFITIGVLDGDYWILNIYRESGATYDKQMLKLKEINSNFQPDVIVMEVNAMQKIFFQMAQDAGLPVLEHTTGVDKYSLTEGLPALAVLYEQGHIKTPRGDQYSIDTTDVLASELMSYTFDIDKNKIISVSGHGDIAMAEWQAIRGAKYVGGGFSFALI